MTELSERLRDERTRAGMSQTALAGEDFSPSYISLIEAGRRMPTDAALAVLADRLGTTADYLRHGDKAPSEERARLEIGFARLALANGAAEEARDRLLALDLSTIAPRHHAEALHALAQAHEALGELDESINVLEPLLKEARLRGRATEAATLATSLVAAYHEAGDLGHSIELGEQVLQELETLGVAGTDEHLRLASTILWSYYERGDLLFAAHRAAELVRLADEAGTMRGRGSIYWNASLVAEGRGDLAEARRLTERALAYLSEGASSRDVPRLRLHYAWLLLRLDAPEPEAALEQLGRAQTNLALVGSEVELARCDFESGRARLLLGEIDAAEDLARSGLGRLDETATLDRCNGHILLGDVLAAQGSLDEAHAAYRWAADMLGMMSAGRESASVWRALGDRLLAHGDLAGAAQAYETALREVGIRPTTTPLVTPGQVASTKAAGSHRSEA
ncbi:helix-turn-helix transcriptional regulator [Actinotalea sp. BY-33]|uniref:Helix-turn-helix transcriptional regulator n=1 Tax=Actinotalea soli TaxID=2819234 RepID=A0A939RSB4_9CELL|nr:helix-turn-helix transcriptional regulator [Actinotalea soli]MBO1750712.1 helix-turn-helix transcriptional regulator [Actinotalea soli]